MVCRRGQFPIARFPARSPAIGLPVSSRPASLAGMLLWWRCSRQAGGTNLRPSRAWIGGHTARNVRESRTGRCAVGEEAQHVASHASARRHHGCTYQPHDPCLRRSASPSRERSKLTWYIGDGNDYMRSSSCGMRMGQSRTLPERGCLSLLVQGISEVTARRVWDECLISALQAG